MPEYLHASALLGTPTMLTNAQRQVMWHADYTPFGTADITVNTIENNLRFPGQYYDTETGLHYNWHRYYDPDTGRYLTPDPIGLVGGINPFVYANNNPLSWIDPLGLDGFAIEGGGGYASDLTGGSYTNGQDYGSGIYIGVKPDSMGHAQIGAYTDKSRPEKLTGSRFGGGLLFIHYYGDARDFFSGTLKYTSDNWFGISGIVYYDSTTGEKKGWAISIGGEGLGLVKDETGTVETTSRCALQD